MAERLLLADDSPTIAKILTMALQSEPYEIITVLTEEEARKELEANPPYFFLVDLSLPGKDGYELSTWVKQNTKLKSVKVVLLASAFESVDQEKYSKCRADGIIQKPFDPSDLRKILRTIMETPPVFSDGKVEGALSGVHIKVEADEPPPPPPSSPAELDQEQEVDLSSLLNENSETSLSADEILSFTNAPLDTAESPQAEPSEISTPPPFSPNIVHEEEDPSATEYTDVTAMINVESDENKLEPPSANEERVLDLSNNFTNEPSNTKSLVIEQPSQEVFTDPSAGNAPPPMGEEKKTDALEKDLSENAQALAAFFDAEIEQQTTPTTEPVEEENSENFDQSLESIDWGSEEQPNLSQWTSNEPQTSETSPMSAPPPFAPIEAEALPIETLSSEPPKFSPPPAATQTNKQTTKKITQTDTIGSFLFDTGNSNFRFADDYIERITKSFSGHENEHVPSQEERPQVEDPLFQNKSSDSNLQHKLGGGAWTGEEIQKMESVIRQEVQTAVREVLEKVAWEIIPDLAENIIKAELEKVMKEMEN